MLVIFVLEIGDYRNTFLTKYFGSGGDEAATKDNSVGKQIVVIVDICHEPPCINMCLNTYTMPRNIGSCDYKCYVQLN